MKLGIAIIIFAKLIRSQSHHEIYGPPVKLNTNFTFTTKKTGKPTTKPQLIYSLSKDKNVDTLHTSSSVFKKENVTASNIVKLKPEEDRLQEFVSGSFTPLHTGLEVEIQQIETPKQIIRNPHQNFTFSAQFPVNPKPFLHQHLNLLKLKLETLRNIVILKNLLYQNKQN